MNFKRIVCVILLAVVMLGYGVLIRLRAMAEASSEQQGPPPAAVEVMDIVLQDVSVEFEYVGRVAASRDVEVRGRVTGIIEKRMYEEGSKVFEGDILFKIDPAMYQADVDAAEAQLAQAEARQRQAEREYNRIKPLVDVQAVSQKELDDALSAKELAEAAVQSAQAHVKAAQIQLDYTDVKAPITGVTGRALKVEGSLVQANGDSLLTTMAQTDPVYVDFSVPESEHLRVRKDIAEKKLDMDSGGFVVHLKTSDGRILNKEGSIGFNDYKSDPATGTFAVRATMANADDALAPGQFVRVILKGAKRPSAVVVPQRCVQEGPAGKFVYLFAEDANGQATAQPQPVEVGEWVGWNGESHGGWIITSGLKRGDKVIVEGTARIFFPGAPVMLAPAEPADVPVSH